MTDNMVSIKTRIDSNLKKQITELQERLAPEHERIFGKQLTWSDTVRMLLAAGIPQLEVSYEDSLRLVSDAGRDDSLRR